MISRLLVANRGEIARRVFRTCRQVGIGTVAVFSDPDAGSPHVAQADLAVRLPGASSSQTYLNGAAIVAAALASGADAVHPGYGFLAEDPEFARQVTGAGLLWVGPPPEAMQAMALKILARKRAAQAGLPVLTELDPAAVTTFPVLVKASAGGGGRGMRAVHNPAELDAAIESASREAQAAFGDGTVFCEPLLTGARHIEVQVLADQHGTVWALTERDCSVQRRYAKVIEETPSPSVTPELREHLLAAAATLAKAVGYVNAGTVEFLVDESSDFYFLEFNTRLQVEHPVTECVHGIDLVALQLAIAEGTPLPAEPPPAAGHAIEARLYAEDPVEGFRPSGGPVHALAVPGIDCEFGLAPGSHLLRLDSGVKPGTVVSAHYDAMLAKVIAWAPSRPAAIRRLATGLAGATIAGPATNRDLLVSVLRDARFTDYGADTSLLDDYDYAGLVPDEQACLLAAAAAAAAIATANRTQARVAAAVPGGWRNVPSQPQRTSFLGPRGRIDVGYRWTSSGISIEEVGDVISVTPDQVRLESGGVTRTFAVVRACDGVWVQSPLGSVSLTRLRRFPLPVPEAETGSLIAPMPGSVSKIAAAAGDAVTAGQLVLVIEAMKMEHQIAAPVSGVVTELRVSIGAQVNTGEVLAIVTDADADQEGQ
ncbi:MAG TPA: biotin carboxylase N-terminal domain-containing protein [Streptosporangiaceae bacterium]|nr:biotin carboxylase N-terminal domain-containing protein [Streptosporangiaceae bacterium]